MTEQPNPYAKYATPDAANPYAKYAGSPSPVATTAPVEKPATTAGGVAASATRGMAPYALGAGVGAGLGALAGGVGAIPGAVAGAGAIGLTELADSLYNPLAEKFGWPKTATPKEMTDKILDLVGERRPSTSTERTVEAGVGGAAGALSGARLAGQAANTLTGPVSQGIAKRLAASPGMQAASGAVGGIAGQAAAESGAGRVGQYAASFLGSLAPSVGAKVFHPATINPKEAAKTAISAGYVIPPIEAAEGRLSPLSIAAAASGESGKIKTAQYAASTNQPVTNRLAAMELGLPADAMLDDRAFEGVRRQAGQAYGAIRQVPAITADQQFTNEVNAIGADARAAAPHYPTIINVEKIDTLINDLTSRSTRPTTASIEAIKRLRFDSKANLKARDDPDKLVLGLAQREAANALDDLMERNLAATHPDLVPAYKDARQLIAKSYDVESVTNSSTGDVSARGLGRLYDKGRPLTGNLKVIADSANDFPRSFQNPAAFGGVEPLSVFDVMVGATAAAHGHPGVAGLVIGRPLARASILSRPYQRAMIGESPNMSLLPAVTNPGFSAITSPLNPAGVTPESPFATSPMSGPPGP